MRVAMRVTVRIAMPCGAVLVVKKNQSNGRCAHDEDQDRSTSCQQRPSTKPSEMGNPRTHIILLGTLGACSAPSTAFTSSTASPPNFFLTTSPARWEMVPTSHPAMTVLPQAAAASASVLPTASI
ncbi:unnamed protein product [Durusdinium trenchii]|uniref:Secreted protein n=1 Tax=Durusdinium trenchii TaxID=1381693 RepID=A0ABP0QK82_9DINO